MKYDEMEFLKKIYNDCKCSDSEYDKDQITPRKIIESDLNTINHKRCYYILQKWCDKGLYDYGVNLDLGWLTPKGIELAINS